MCGVFHRKPVIKAMLAAVAMCLFALVIASGWTWNWNSNGPGPNAPQAGWTWNYPPYATGQPGQA